MSSYVTVQIGFEQALIAIDKVGQEMNAALADSIDPLLDFIEAAQIHKYTANSDPPKPPGSTYIRTGDLRDSSEKSHAAGSFEGEWRATADSAQYVLGSRSEQAPVHRGRWLPTEEVEQMAVEAADGIINEQVEKRLR